MYRERSSSLSAALPLIFVAAFVVAGWWLLAGRGTGSTPVDVPVPSAESEAVPYLLHPGPLGAGWVEQQPRKTTIAELQTAGDGLGEGIWEAGATAGFDQVAGPGTIESRAEVFTTSDLTTVVAALRSDAERRYQGTAEPGPIGSPGDVSYLITGRSPQGNQAAVLLWQHGSVIGIVTVTGLRADGVPERAATLAGLQDRWIEISLR